MTTRSSARRLAVGLLHVCLVLAVLLAPACLGAAGTPSVAIGYTHACAVTSGGGLKCWGNNDYGQLGDGTTTWHLTPAYVSGLSSGVASAGAGTNHSCAVTTGGGVKCWGGNSNGQLGDGTVTMRATPISVSGLSAGVRAVGAGFNYTCALTTAGGLKCWGSNGYGQLGDGTATVRKTPTDVSGLSSGVAAFAVAARHACAVTTVGAVKCWGDNAKGQLGDGSTTSQSTPVSVPGLASGVAAVAAGDTHTCALTTDGAVMCWGFNVYGQLGDGTSVDRLTPTSASGLSSGVASIAAGVHHACALTTAGAVRCWGFNYYGELGDGTTNGRYSPVVVGALATAPVALAAGGYETCVVTSGGGLRCWGENHQGELGNGTSWIRGTPTSVIGFMSGAARVSPGKNHACAVTTAGGAKCWGLNSEGEIGDGTTTNRATPTGVAGLTSGVVTVVASTYHSCALTTGGGVKCWGYNAYGNLGDGTTVTRNTPVDVSGLTSGVSAITLGTYHTCALTSAGGVKCWGYNGSGQLGNGTTTQSYTPADVTGLTSGVAAIDSGAFHTCAVTTAGGLKCWGQGSSGQLGDGGTSNRSSAVDVSGLTSGVASVAGGSYFTCAATTGGAVKCWGNNGFGQLGDLTMTSRLTPVAVTALTSGVASLVLGGYHACALTTGGGLKCWGANSVGQMGDGTAGVQRLTPSDVPGMTSDVAAAAGGENNTCAVMTNGAALCWGDDMYGQVGDLSEPRDFGPARTVGFGRADFDADDLADAAVYRPSTGTWFSLDSSSGNANYRYRGWGSNAWGDTPVLGDFDGDGVLDPTVFRPGTGSWFILLSKAGFTTWTYFGWGSSGDTLVPGDYDGDGRTDAAVYRASTGTWYVRRSSDTVSWNLAFGNATDQPIAGDFDGDGKRDVAVYRASTGTWFWLTSSSNYTTMEYKGWGVNAQGDTPAPGDYDGDGKTDLCVFRPGTGTWYILQSSSGFTSMAYFGWGTTGDTVAPADYDGDGRTDAAIYRASTFTWYIRPSSGATQWNKVFGSAGDVPLVTIR